MATTKTSEKSTKKPIVISVSNVKGGVVKTTTAATLAAGLNKLKKKKVLLIDADPQTNLTMCFMDEPEDSSTTLYALFNENKGIDELKVNLKKGLDIVPGDFELCSADIEFAMLPKRLEVLSKAIKKIEENYDFIIFDTPPNLGILTLNAFTASDYILTPMAAETFSLKAIKLLKKAKDWVEEDSEKELPVIGVLLTKYTDRFNISKAIEEYVNESAKLLDTKIFKSRIRNATVVLESQYVQSDLFEYAPKHPVTKDYEEFINEFLKRIGG